MTRLTPFEVRLVNALIECSNDLEAEIKARYGDAVATYPSELRRCLRDLEPVVRAQALIAEVSREDESGQG